MRTRYAVLLGKARDMAVAVSGAERVYAYGSLAEDRFECCWLQEEYSNETTTVKSRLQRDIDQGLDVA